MQLTLFDLDNTLLAGDSDYLWGRFLVDEGVVDAEFYARENERFHAQYEAGNLDIHAYQRFALAPLLTNSLERMQALRADYVERVIRPLVARHTRALLDSHRQRGDMIAIITATNRFITEPIAALLGIDVRDCTAGYRGYRRGRNRRHGGVCRRDFPSRRPARASAHNTLGASR